MKTKRLKTSNFKLIYALALLFIIPSAYAIPLQTSVQIGGGTIVNITTGLETKATVIPTSCEDWGTTFASCAGANSGNGSNIGRARADYGNLGVYASGVTGYGGSMSVNSLASFQDIFTISSSDYYSGEQGLVTLGFEVAGNISNSPGVSAVAQLTVVVQGVYEFSWDFSQLDGLYNPGRDERINKVTLTTPFFFDEEFDIDVILAGIVGVGDAGGFGIVDHYNTTTLSSIGVSVNNTTVNNFSLQSQSGSSYPNVNLQNIQVVPEPSTIALLFSGMLILLRKSKRPLWILRFRVLV